MLFIKIRLLLSCVKAGTYKLKGILPKFSVFIVVIILLSTAGCASSVNTHIDKGLSVGNCNTKAVQDGVIAVSHSGLKELADTAKLVPGQKYRISDFRTRHTIPYTSEINTGPIEVLIVTAVTANSLASIVHSESYPQDIIEYELVNTSIDPAFDKGRIIYRKDTSKNVSSYEDWRSVKYRRGRNPVTGKFTDVSNFSNGSVDMHPFNNSPNPEFVSRVHVGKTNGNGLPNIVIGTGKSSVTEDVFIGHGSNHITIGDHARTIEIAQANGDILIGEHCNHIRIGVCSDGATIGDWSYHINIGNLSGPITIKDHTSSCNVGDNVTSLTLGDGVTASQIYVGHGVNIRPSPTITASGTLEKYMSTIPSSIDITGRTILDLTAYKYAGIVSLTSTKSTELLNMIQKNIDPDEPDFPLELCPRAGLQLKLAGTSFDALSADGQIMLKGDVRLNGDKGDSITLKRKSIGKYTVFVEVSRSVN